MEIEVLYRIFQQHPIVTTDTRNCPSNSIFFALKGENFNGNKFASQALEKGCAYAIVDEPEYADQEKIILVDNCLKTLQQLANYHRKALQTKVIGITGTNGKTTTKELIAAVLSTKYNILFTQGNLNNHIGVPLTLLQLTKDHELAVIEMGASHPGDIKELVEIAEPDYGIITNIGKAHLQGFGSLEGVISTKGELFDYLRTKPDSVVFIPHEDIVLKEMAKGLKQIDYGTTPDLYVSGITISFSPFLKLSWASQKTSEKYTVSTQLIGAYNLQNVLAAATIGCFFNISPKIISQALENYIPHNNRSQLKKTEHNHLIIDAYNANPTSMMSALINFRDIKADNKTVILGDMKELGDISEKEHLEVIHFLNKSGFENILLIGEEFNKIPHTFKGFTDVSDLIIYLKNYPLKNKLILIKGSNSIRLIEAISFL